MARRFDLGRALLVVGAVLLLASLFLEWYDTGQSGWQVFEALDLALLAIAAAALWVALAPDDAPKALGVVAPAAAVVIVALQLVDPPPAAGSDAAPSSGAWLALGGSLAMAVGAALSLAAISVTVSVADREIRGRRVPAVDRREERQPADAVVDDDDRTQPFSMGDDEGSRSLLRRDTPSEDPERP